MKAHIFLAHLLYKSEPSCTFNVCYGKKSLLWNDFAMVEVTADGSGAPLSGRLQRLLDDICWGGEFILCKLTIELVFPVFGMEQYKGLRLVPPADHIGTSCRNIAITRVVYFKRDLVSKYLFYALIKSELMIF